MLLYSNLNQSYKLMVHGTQGYNLHTLYQKPQYLYPGLLAQQFIETNKFNFNLFSKLVLQ